MRIAFFLTHPIQYQSPLIRRMVEGGIDIHVIYGYNLGAEGRQDPGFKRPVTWDVPLLGGYSHEFLTIISELPARRLPRFLELVRRVRATLDRGNYHVVWIHGWGNPHPVMPFYSLAVMLGARGRHLPLIMRGDTQLLCLRGGRFRKWMHRILLGTLFRQVAAFLAVGTANATLYEAYGVPKERIFLAPYAVDNAFFQRRCQQASATRDNFRAGLGLPEDALVLLYCGRLAPEKDPETLIRATEILQRTLPNHALVLLIVGEGPMREEVEALASRCHPGSVRLLGFRNQTELPALYDLCDVFVLPSTFEPFGLVVNEVMNAGKPVIASDQVGCAPDLVKRGVNGDWFRAGDVADLVRALTPLLNDATRRRQAGEESRRIISHWGVDESFAGVNQALEFLSSRHP